MDQMPMAPVSIGELADKITILEIKSEHIFDEQKKVNINLELALLMEVFTNFVPQTKEMTDALSRLRVVNLEIWNLQDKIHELKKKNNLSQEEVVYYRVVHTKNDERFVIKKEINSIMKSKISEEKSY